MSLTIEVLEVNYKPDDYENSTVLFSVYDGPDGYISFIDTINAPHACFVLEYLQCITGRFGGPNQDAYYNFIYTIANDSIESLKIGQIFKEE